LPFLQHAAPVLQHDTTCAVSQHPLSLPDFAADLSPFFLGHLSPQQPLPFWLAAISHLPPWQQLCPQQELPLAMAWFLWPAMSHLPPLQQLSLQQDSPSAIFPSLPMGHLLEQQGQALALSPLAGAAGAAWVALCAIIASANNIVTTTIINFVFMSSSSLEAALQVVLERARLELCRYSLRWNLEP
jgi:hypothetical protein